jgi:hypothetical protein
MRIVQIYREASPPPYGYHTISVVYDDGSAATMHVPPYLIGGDVRKWIERKSGKKVRAWKKAIPRRSPTDGGAGASADANYRQHFAHFAAIPGSVCGQSLRTPNHNSNLVPQTQDVVFAQDEMLNTTE